MATATAQLEQGYVDLQFGPNVMWSDLSASDAQINWVVPAQAVRRSTVDPEAGVRALYARLSREYEEMEPGVPDRRGGVEGDLFPF